MDAPRDRYPTVKKQCSFQIGRIGGFLDPCRDNGHQRPDRGLAQSLYDKAQCRKSLFGHIPPLGGLGGFEFRFCEAVFPKQFRLLFLFVEKICFQFLIRGFSLRQLHRLLKFLLSQKVRFLRKCQIQKQLSLFRLRFYHLRKLHFYRDGKIQY